MILNLEERMELLPGVDPRRVIHEMPWSLRGELVATYTARDRLRRWVEAGMPEADPDAATYVGDEAVAESARCVLEKIPPPVLWHVVEHCLLVGVGKVIGGFADEAPTEFAEPRILVVFGTNTAMSTIDFDGLIAHELSHSWLHSVDEPRPVVTVFERLASRQHLESFSAEMDMLPRLERIDQRRESRKERHELEACALTRAWGFTGFAAHHKRRRRQ